MALNIVRISQDISNSIGNEMTEELFRQQKIQTSGIFKIQMIIFS